MAALAPPVLHALAQLRYTIKTANSSQLNILYIALIGLAGDALAGISTVTVYGAGENVQNVHSGSSQLGHSQEPAQSEPDQAITAGQCARLSGWKRRAAPGDRAGFSPRWFYDHADELPFRIGGRGHHPVRFSRRGYSAWLRAR